MGSSSLLSKFMALQEGAHAAIVGSQAVLIVKRVMPVLLQEIEQRGDLDPKAAMLLVPDDCKDGIGWVSGESVRLGAAFVASLLMDERKRS